jgi:hypothetical protein
MRSFSTAILLLTLAWLDCARARADEPALDEATLVAGLKELLHAAVRGAAARAGRRDGYRRDPALRLAIPRELDPMVRGLRRAGLRGPVEEFELALNRTAESAAGEAAPLLDAAIEVLAFPDARALARGPDAVLTDLLRRTSGEELRTRYAPIVARCLRTSGALPAYQRLVEHWRALEPARPPSFDLEAHATEAALDRLFAAVATEERRIRGDPAARAGSEAPVGER